MKAKKLINAVIIAANIIGVICLAYLAVPLLTHDTYVANPDAMLPMERWDGAGWCITLGTAPMMIANALGFGLVGAGKKLPARLAWFLPSAICAALAAWYLVVSFAV